MIDRASTECVRLSKNDCGGILQTQLNGDQKVVYCPECGYTTPRYQAERLDPEDEASVFEEERVDPTEEADKLREILKDVLHATGEGGVVIDENIKTRIKEALCDPKEEYRQWVVKNEGAAKFAFEQYMRVMIGEGAPKYSFNDLMERYQDNGAVDLVFGLMTYFDGCGGDSLSLLSEARNKYYQHIDK